jgi:hypothetical protein
MPLVAVPRDESVLRAGHASRRWANIVSAITHSDDDLPTLSKWSDSLQKSPGTIKRWCKLCNLHAGDALDFGRALCIVVHYAGTNCWWYEVLAIAEPATMRRFLDRAGFVANEPVPDIETYLRKQQFVKNKAVLEAIRQSTVRADL